MNQRTPQNRTHPEYLPWRSKRMVSRETRRMQGGALASSTAVAFCNTRKRCRCVCRGNPCGCPLNGADGVQLISPLFAYALRLFAICCPLLSHASVAFCITLERGHLPAPSSARQAGLALDALFLVLLRHGAGQN